jgi:hypothetical protein
MSKRPLPDDARGRALDALAMLRKPERYGRLSASDAARHNRTTVQTMRRAAGHALRKVEGKWSYSPRDDRGVRTTSILTQVKGELQWVQTKVRGLVQASKAGHYARAVHDGRWSIIESYKGRYITDIRGKRRYFATDRQALRRLDREGGLRPKGLHFS